MDSFNDFMDIFKRTISQRDSSNLTETLKNRKYFQNIAKDDSELILSKLFDKEKGLLCFLNNELQRSIPQKGFDTAMKEAFHLLEFIIEQFSEIFEPYIIQTKDICQLALKTRCSAFIKKAACSVFNKLIKLFNGYEINLSETIKEFVSWFHLMDTKERCLLLPVLGTIAKHNPEIPEIQQYSVVIFQVLRNDLKKQYNPESASQSTDILQIYLEVLSDILEELPNEIKEKYCEEMYEWVKNLSCPEKYAVKKVTMRSAINLLSRHIYQFRDFVYRDYKFWYNLLINLSQDKNTQCSECGQRALKCFYRTISNVLKHKTSEEDKAIFLYFKNFFEEQLKNNHQINSNMLRILIYGFSQMAAPCKRYFSDNDVRNMFSLIAHCAMTLCFRDDLERAHLESICDYQEALSTIIVHTSGLSIDEINIILKLSILLIKKFPDIPITGQSSAISSLINTISNIGIISKNLLEEYLYNLIQDGVIWTCSHTLFIDAELKRGLKSFEERPLCYKDYLPLWLQLLKRNRYKKHEQVTQTVVDSMIEVCIILISKLNLNTKTKEDNVFSDVAFSQIAENKGDFRMFVNIVDLYVDIINELESSLLVNTMYKFFFKIISMSYKHPLISGFYKLVHAIFKHIRNLTKDQLEVEMLELLYKYLINLLNLISTFSNELLTTCLYLIFNMPEMYVERVLDNTIPAFKVAFTVGLSEFELACTALNAVEKWTSYLDNRHTNEFLREIVPCLEPYLHSDESSVERLQDIIKTERKVIKHIVLTDDKNTLQRFQMRVLLFIASLDTDIIMDFIYKRSMDTGATWNKKDILEYSLIFSETEIDIHFDKILPRLVLLAQSSGDRRTKIAACEVLHSIVTFVLGKTSQYLTSNPDQFVPIYTILCPALLHLGCDFDEAAKNIFQPLMIQLTHWLSSKFMLKSPATTYFIDSLFNGLSNDSNLSLREFSGMCLAEFTNWSIKQSDNEKMTRINIEEVISKMANFALHPSISKRIAAAIAFNHLYIILREDEEIVSIYWLEILYCFTKSLDGCNNPAIITALDHIERVIIAKRNLLNAKHHNRRKPYEFEGTTLTDAVNWLLTQCGCIDQCCRTKCMELVIKFSGCIPNCDPAKTVINNYIDVYGIENFKLIILKDLKSKIESLSCSTIHPLLRSFDCFIWIIRNDLLSIQYLFTNLNLEKEIIFNYARNFIHVVNNIKIEVKEVDFMILSKEFEDLQTLQCKMIITLFDLLQLLLRFDENFIPDFFFNKDLFELISKCIMYPQLVGFDTKNLEFTETFPLVMNNLLQSIIQKNDNFLLNHVKHELFVYVEKYRNNFIDLDKIVNGTESCNDLKQYICGLSFLEQHGILSQLINAPQFLEQSKNYVTCIFKVLAKELIGELICVNIKSSVKDYLQILMKLLFTHYESSMIRTLIKLIETNTLLGSGFNKIEHGMYFLNMFKNEIFIYMLKDIEETMNAFDDLLQGNIFLLLTIMEQLLLFVQRHKKELHNYTEVLVDSIVKRFTAFENNVNNFEDRKQKLISIYGIAVRLKQKPTELISLNKDFYNWILNQLMENSDIEYKIRILQNFLVCLTDMTFNTGSELLVILRSLRNNRLATCPNDFLQRNVKTLKTIHCFQTLLKLLPVTKSIVVFETIILFAIGITDYLCDEKTKNEYLRKYFNLITAECAVKSLEKAYKLFMNWNYETNERIDLLYKFLIPLFQFCKTVEIRQFFERNIREIYTIIHRSLVGSSSDMKQLIASKIGCYDLIAIMFANIHLKEIVDIESTITRNAIDNVVTGKELLQNLYSSALNVRMLKTPDPEQKEMIRLLHCSAYNCSIAIVCLKEDEDSYVSIFAENKKKEQLIWENIVDCQKQYNFQQTLKEYPKHCKKLINIRKKKKQGQISERYSYIYSYDLSTCTLQEDINAYDFNNAVVYNKSISNDKEESMNLIFESDKLNDHECMATICGALNHMLSKEISVPPSGDDIVMPKWLKCFSTAIISTNYDNVRLFMLKIVLNMQTVFKPYAKLFLQSIMHAMYSHLKVNRLNYIIADVIEMLIDWQTVPNQPSGKVMAQKLWEIIIHRALIIKTNESSMAVHKYNRNIIRTILEMWKTCLKLPENLSDGMKNTPAAAVYLILICFVNEMGNDIVQRNDILEFLEKSLENWKNDEETVLQCCECFGLILKFLDDDDKQTHRKCAIIDKIRSILRQMQIKFENRQIKYIRTLCKNYPNAGMIYFEFVSANISRVDALGKSNCLEIFSLCIPNFTADQILKELDYVKFQDLLRNKILPCEKVALRIINSLIPVLQPSNLLPLVNLVPPYIKHESYDYREIAYDIFMNIYKKYAFDTSEDENIKQIVQSSKEMLFNGILDPDERLQEKILNFWTKDTQLSCTCKERLLETLSTYTPTAGNNFLPFVLLVILDLTKKSKNYTKKMFGPLHNCSYRDFKIALSWRIKNFGSKAPLFVPSLASQMNQTVIQTNTLPDTTFDFTYTRPSSSFNTELKLRATQDPEFEPTYVNEEPIQTSNELEYNDGFEVPVVPQPAYNKKSKRFLSSSHERSAAIREKEIKKNIQRDNMIKEEVTRQRSTVKLYRQYRIGDFPDTEISHATLIEPLQQLVKKDQLICKDLTVCIVCSLLKEQRHDDFVEKVGNCLKHIIEDQQGTNSCITAILEILLNTHIIKCSPEVITKLSKLNSSNFLGPLVLEENIINNVSDFQPPKKKARTTDLSDFSDEWLQLINLYESMNDIDVVLSIFQNHITDENMREAVFSQAANNWVRAKAAYENAYETESELVKEHCLQGLFVCLNNLCMWDEVDKHLKKKLDGDINNIWNESWKDWIFPWLFEVQVRKLVDGSLYNNTSDNSINIINLWFKDDEKMKHIKRYFGAELSLFFLELDKLETARDFLLNTLDEIREQWIKLHPLSTQLRIHILQKLRIINDVDRIIKVLKTAKGLSDLQKIFKFWNKSVPSAQDAILPWDKLISYRMYFINSPLNKKVEKWTENEIQNSLDSVLGREEIEIEHTFQTVMHNMRLKMVEAALNQKNKFIAKKYLCQMEQDTTNYSPNLKQQFTLTSAKFKYLSGEIYTNMTKKLSKYASSWKICHALLQENDLSPMVHVGVRQQISQLASKIVELSKQNEVFSELLAKNTTILNKINVENDNLSTIRNSLEIYGLNHLKTCCDKTTTNMKECYFILSKYCYERLSCNTSDVQLSKEFVNSTLKAMSYGSLEAAHYFPCLLKPTYFENEEIKDIFLKESEKIETWIFLSWQAQLFSHLGTSIAPLIIPILKRIVETYPDAVIYTFRLTVETNPALLNETRTYEIRQILYNRPKIDQFLLAMQYVVQPELYLQYYLSEFIKNLSLGTSTALNIFLEKVYPEEYKYNLKPGSIFKEIERYKGKIKELEHKKPEEIKLHIDKMKESIKKLLERRKDKLKLQDYSPWLCKFCERDIEIPGQYTGNRKPMPQYHAKIIKFESTVKVMQSLRKPIRITMVGNDAKEYYFLVKFGEDLRQDQRLQQLFAIMNKTLYIDTACKQRRLSIDTYQVIPLSRTVGLIQWINNTKSLQELIDYTLSKQEKNRYDSICEEYKKWIRSTAPSKRLHEMYKEATIKYNASKVIIKMNELISKTEWDCLRRTFKTLCPSIESFVTVRRNFITTYSTMCIAHWILGIGDRHLENILIAVDSGRCLGIDFGLAFDAGIDKQLPELMPFRLTPQILGLLKPFTEKDLLGATMIHVLRALRNEQGPILSCMNVFVHEPLNWTEHINKALGENEEDTTDIKWMPMKKIEAVMKKLNGIKPSLITLKQLREQHDDKYFNRYYAIVTGDDDIKRIRAKIEDNDLTPEKQVECLLDQATDLNILGRSYVGWKPWL